MVDRTCLFKISNSSKGRFLFFIALPAENTLMSAADEAQLEALRAVISDLQQSPLLEKFVSLWKEMGIQGQNLVTRQDTMRLHIHNLMEEMYKEELVLKDKLIDSISQCTQKLAELCTQLSLPFNGPADDLPLALKEKELRHKVDTFTKEKHNRLKRLKRLAEVEEAMCKTMGESTHLDVVLRSGAVPSDEELKKYREMVGQLEQTKSERQEEFRRTRSKLMQLWQEMEIEPHQEFEQLVAKGDVNKFGLTVENMSRLHKFHAELEEEAAHLEARAHQLRQSIHSLWDRLEVPQEERDAFSQQYVGHKPKIISALCAEISRLDELKKQHMQKFVEATRLELHAVWDQCMYGPQQRQEFSAAFSDDFSEDLLSAHESELDRMRGFYQDNRDIFEQVQKRERLWQQQLELDKQSNDPNRFTNRGGQLQKQLKLRKQLEKELPRAEKELKAVLLQWEEDHERYFVVNDTRYLDAMESQIMERSQEKELEKMKKKRDKEETLKFEMTYGSKPCTPIKRRGGTTPTSCKQRRVGPSPLHSAVRASSKRLQTTVSSKRPGLPKTPGGQRTAPRRILAEKNCGPNPDETFLSQVNMSLASTGSYTDFQQGLHTGLDSQRSARSSFLPKSSSTQSLADK